MNHDPYEAGFIAGAASRNVEVARLKQTIAFQKAAWTADYKERDQLREQVAVLREALKDAYPWEIHFQENCDCSFCEALYATEPKP